jgi:hypothetical protein
MLKRPSLPRAFAMVALLASVALPAPRTTYAQTPAGINFHYWNGPVIQSVKVATLFWGPYWASASADVSYFNNFFQALFADGRFMANVAQYSTGNTRISNGSWNGSDVDAQALPNAKQVTDTQIRAEILAQVAAGKLPAPDANTMYCVFTPPGVVVVDGNANSTRNFDGYHHSAKDTQNQGYTYALVVGRSDPDPATGAGRLERGYMTSTASHELSEVVTDPLDDVLSWYDAKYGEVGDIVADLYGDLDPVYDVLVGPDGVHYWVQKIWSNKDSGPVAFAPVAGAP